MQRGAVDLSARITADARSQQHLSGVRVAKGNGVVEGRCPQLTGLKTNLDFKKLK